MKLATESKYEAQSNMSGRVVQATIDPSQLAMVMDLLIRNYNEPYLAVLREYVANGIDSHKEAGVNRPVEVTLPTAFSGVLKVQDFGIGLSADDVVEIYSKFLASTKRDTDDLIGAYGIGSKSGLAVSDQFTVTSVKDSLKNIFVVTRVNNGLDYKFAIEDAPTNDPNGVTISIPMDASSSNYNSYSLSRVLGGWKSSEVKVLNGESFSRIADDWIELEYGYVHPKAFDRGSSRSFNNFSRTNIVVGTVVYEYSNFRDIVPSMFNDYGEDSFAKARRVRDIVSSNAFALKLPIEAITFPSSREVIEKTDENIDAIIQKASDFDNEIFEYIQKKANNFLSLREAVDFKFSFIGKYFIEYSVSESLTYNGKEIPTGFSVNSVHSYINNSSGYRNYGENYVRFSYGSPFSILVNDKKDVSISTIKRSIADYWKFNLEGFESLSSRENYKVIDQDEITEELVELAESVEYFSDLREIVLAERRKVAKLNKEANKNKKVKLENTFANRKVFINGRETTLQKAIEFSSEKKNVFIKRKNVIIPNIFKDKWDYENSVAVEVDDRISDNSFMKYKEALNAEIMDENWNIAHVKEYAKGLMKREDYEDIVTIFKSSYDENYNFNMKNYQEFNNYITSLCDESSKISQIFAYENLGEEFTKITGISKNDCETHEAFALCSVIANSYVNSYRDTNFANNKNHYEKYMIEQAKEHLNFTGSFKKKD